MTTRRVLMVAFPGAQILDVTGPLQMFAGVNEALRGVRAYELAIAAPRKGPFRTSSGVRLVADLALSTLRNNRLARIDTLIVAGGDPGLRVALEEGEITVVVKRAVGRVRRIASVCSGAFFLAAAGVLDGRRAATHWRVVERLRRFRPQVQVDDDAIYVRDGNIWTSAGVTAGIDLALAMIEADHGREMALVMARYHVVFRMRSGGQSQFSSELAAQAARDSRLAKLAQTIAAKPQADWRLEMLAAEAGLSLRSLNRIFRRELKASPAAFVERLRVDRARKSLLETGASIESVAVACGFGSLRRMDRAFARVVHTSPKEFRARFKPNGASP